MNGAGVTGSMATTPCAPTLLQHEEYLALLAALLMIGEPCHASVAIERAMRLAALARKAAMQDTGCVL